MFSAIGIDYDSKWKRNFWGEVKETVYTYNVYVKDEFKYQTFMNELNDLVKKEAINISFKMRFETYSNISQFVRFPGTITGSRGGRDDEFDYPEEWVKIYMFIEMKL